MARLTASGAAAGANALPPRRHALLPGTVGPDAGNNEFAFADDECTTAAKKAAPIKVLGLREYTSGFGACPMPQDRRLQRKKSPRRHLRVCLISIFAKRSLLRKKKFFLRRQLRLLFPRRPRSLHSEKFPKRVRLES